MSRTANADHHLQAVQRVRLRSRKAARWTGYQVEYTDLRQRQSVDRQLSHEFQLKIRYTWRMIPGRVSMICQTQQGGLHRKMPRRKSKTRNKCSVYVLK